MATTTTEDTQEPAAPRPSMAATTTTEDTQEPARPRSMAATTTTEDTQEPARPRSMADTTTTEDTQEPARPRSMAAPRQQQHRPALDGSTEAATAPAPWRIIPGTAAPLLYI